jgi:hypothetical protein
MSGFYFFIPPCKAGQKKGQKNKIKYAKGVLKKGAKKIPVASPHLLIFFFSF